ncbi:D-2-hydroxyacid dehydrogenase [Phenylobacterium aquaticum]|uniref:D-2-hydroxyacid dehydrogenase n=1 Tax=Phenylobacterium aquaticum TaxID=1763816 RepID=UPI001F5E170C|nr:D-2-hydroxyacid dehydrogenase [Phenylobacterium aquaticum]MCI3133027.1 D-2-hydroxyacid dehydrogenase [Phenylobacterium aquaticum]
MQLLMSAAAFERVKDRISPFAPGLDIITAVGPDSFQRNGADYPAASVDPDIVWTTLDAYAGGQMPALIGAILKGTKPCWLQTFNAGLDAPIFKSIMAKGVRISKSNAQAVAIAEYVVGHALSLILPIDRARALQAEKSWKPTPYREVSQSRWTLIGYGSIGREIAQRVKSFGAHLTVVRRHVGSDDLADLVTDMSALPEVLPQSDVVVLACALTDETRGMANAGFFAAMKPGSILINIGRGGLVDEDALRVGLDTDQPAHAVLDVFAVEPLPQDSWIWEHPKIRVTAHTSNSGLGTPGRGDDLFVANLKRYLNGEPLLNEAHPSEVGL